jgi:hypothetical protein
MERQHPGWGMYVLVHWLLMHRSMVHVYPSLHWASVIQQLGMEVKEQVDPMHWSLVHGFVSVQFSLVVQHPGIRVVEQLSLIQATVEHGLVVHGGMVGSMSEQHPGLGAYWHVLLSAHVLFMHVFVGHSSLMVQHPSIWVLVHTLVMALQLSNVHAFPSSHW